MSRSKDKISLIFIFSAVELLCNMVLHPNFDKVNVVNARSNVLEKQLVCCNIQASLKVTVAFFGLCFHYSSKNFSIS